MKNTILMTWFLFLLTSCYLSYSKPNAYSKNLVNKKLMSKYFKNKSNNKDKLRINSSSRFMSEKLVLAN